MRVLAGLLVLIVAAIAAFATLNWSALLATTEVSLGFMHVSAQLGLIMLILTIALGVGFLIYVILTQSASLVESRRQSRELANQRELADKAESSRFTELRKFLEQQEEKRSARRSELHSAVLARVDQSDHTLAAHLGQLEDRLDRPGAPRASLDRPAPATEAFSSSTDHRRMDDDLVIDSPRSADDESIVRPPV